MSTENEIFQTTLWLFAKKGYEATSIRDIAKEIGITSSSLYYYFKGKEDLLLSIMKKDLNSLIAIGEEIITNIKHTEEQIASIVQVHVIYHGMNQLSALITDTEFRALHGENKEVIKKLRKDYENIWKRIVEKGVSEGKFKKVKNIKFCIYALLAMCNGVLHWYSPEGEKKLLNISEMYADMALNLLGVEVNNKEILVSDLSKKYITKYCEEIRGEIKVENN